MSEIVRRIVGEDRGARPMPRRSIFDGLEQSSTERPMSARDFILSNPRPDLEVEFEMRLREAGYPHAFCRNLGKDRGMAIWLDRPEDRREFFGLLVLTLREIAAEFGLRIPPRRVQGVMQGLRYLVRFPVEPAPPNPRGPA